MSSNSQSIYNKWAEIDHQPWKNLWHCLFCMTPRLGSVVILSNVFSGTVQPSCLKTERKMFGKDIKWSLARSIGWTSVVYERKLCHISCDSLIFFRFCWWNSYPMEFMPGGFWGHKNPAFSWLWLLLSHQWMWSADACISTAPKSCCAFLGSASLDGMFVRVWKTLWSKPMFALSFLEIFEFRVQL